ncbi:MAG: Serine/threonine-protein phosphatase 2A activator 1 [Peltula sp. TS41687]|nr:MAG: Serine/threonine-protein phosphatase 2A activator 1 [Peltula sp. TS41687]
MAARPTALDLSSGHTFMHPTKRIHDEQDISHFHNSQAYSSIVTFLFQLNVAMFPQHQQPGSRIQAWELDSSQTQFSRPVRKLSALITKLDAIIDEAPPDLVGPRRFGNVSFRKWYTIVEAAMPGLLAEHLPDEILSLDRNNDTGGEKQGDDEAEEADKIVRARDELSAYLLGSFGSAQRLDYGTGHELSFLAFLGGIWRLGGFEKSNASGIEERGVVLGILEPYFQLIRRLIKTYTLEPAGSHGVWGLDDHFFLPYIFGSAQFCPAIHSVGDQLPSDGSLGAAPDPSEITRSESVERLRKNNMYFAAIGFINDVKKGPFWEHSRVLYDISGVPQGWAKINKGMLKMYNGEVLAKFPVIQHFPFGSIFSWDLDPGNNSNNPNPPPPPSVSASVPTTSQPPLAPQPPPRLLSPPATNLHHGEDYTSSLPTVSANIMNPPPTLAQGRFPVSSHSSAAAAGVHPHPHPHPPPLVGIGAGAGTKAPWAKPAGSGTSTATIPPQPSPPPPTPATTTTARKTGMEGMGTTRAPWA